MVLCEHCQLYHAESQSSCIGLGSPGGLELTERAVSLCALPPAASLLDLGCSNGCSVEMLRSKFNLSATGADRSWQFLQQGLQRLPGLPLFQALAEQLPLPSAGLDALLVDCAFNLMGAGQVLSEIRRLLKPGGKLILADVYTRNPAYSGSPYLAKTCCLAAVLSKERIVDLLQSFGFVTTVWQDHSEVLKQWLARMVFSLGSIEQVYRQLLLEPDCLDELRADLSQASLSYYLLIAEKQAG